MCGLWDALQSSISRGMTKADLMRPVPESDDQTTVRMPKELKHRLARYSASVGMTQSTLIVRILLAGLEELEREQ
jgi:hypothetical protein